MNVTRSMIVDGLRRLGICPGDVLLVHSSMKSLGQVDGGPETVVGAMLEAVGPEGLFILPTFSSTFIRPDSGQAEHAYDPATTPSRVGLITNTARQRPDAHRSRHPTHSLTAIGSRAEDFAADGEDLYRTFDRTGPYGRLVLWEAKILLLGCTMAANTTFHAVEDWLELPYIAARRGRCLVARKDGTNIPVEVTFCPGGHRDFYFKDRRTKIEVVLRNAGVVTDGLVGQAPSMLMPARQCVSVTARHMESDPAVLLCDDEACAFCSDGRRECFDDLPAIRQRARRLRDEGFLD